MGFLCSFDGVGIVFLCAMRAFSRRKHTGDPHARRCLSRARPRRLCRLLGLRAALRADVAMFDLVLGGIVTAFLLVYLVAAMVRPDKF